MIGMLWAYEGWQYVTFSAGETRDPQRVFPRAITVATAALIVIYMLANSGYLAALGRAPRPRATTSRPMPCARSSVGGGQGGRRADPRVDLQRGERPDAHRATPVLLDGARRRLLQRLARVSPRFGTPAFAIVAIAVWSVAARRDGTFEQLLTYVVFTGWVF